MLVLFLMGKKSEFERFSVLLSELVVALRNADKFYDFSDVHSGQFGRNKEGSLKVFDLSTYHDQRKFKKT